MFLLKGKVKVSEALTERPYCRSEFKVSALMRVRPLSRYMIAWSYRHIAVIHDRKGQRRQEPQMHVRCYQHASHRGVQSFQHNWKS